MKLYIIRHGDPDYENDCLTPLGCRQAEALARRFAIHEPDRIFSSPLGRAQETAQPTCELLKKKITILDWISESTAYEQMLVPEKDGTRWCWAQQNTNYKNDKTIRLYDDWQKAHKDFERDSVRECVNRIGRESDRFLEQLGYRREGSIYRILSPSEESIAVFCHQGAGLTWYSHLMRIPPHIVWSTFDIAHTGVTLFHFENFSNGVTAPKCLMMSDLSHIMNDGLPMKFENRIDL